VLDPQGQNPKSRPLVIVSSDAAIRKGEPIVAASISTSYQQADPAEYVILPWNSQGNTQTQLKKDCAAVCTWLVEIHPRDIIKYGGRVPDQQMQEIFEKLRQIKS